MIASSQPLSTLAPHVGDHAGQFDSGRLQDFLQPLDVLTVLRDQAFALAHQIPQHSDGLGGNETGAAQAMAEPVGHPFALAHVSCAAWEGLDLMGIGQQQLKLVFQHRVERPPKDAGADPWPRD